LYLFSVLILPQERYLPRSALGALQEVRPVLHHPGAGLQVEGVIVGSEDGISLSVGKLQFNVLMRIALLMQNGGGKSPEAVAGHPALESHPLQGSQDGVVAHGLLRVVISRE